MNSNLQTPMFTVLERYLEPWEEAFTLVAMSNRALEVWDLRQILLTDRILARIRKLIEDTNAFTQAEKDELVQILAELLDLGMPDFIAGMKANPVHHNFQVVENILRICIGERKLYQFVKSAVILALLHDIGNGLVDRSLEKIKTSDLKEKRDELQKKRVSPDEVCRHPEMCELVAKAKDYRLAHMIEGAKRARKVLAHLNKRFQERFDHTVVDDTNIEDVVECIEIHDAPSIAECYSELGQPVDPKYLIPFGNKLASVLREADRLWMVSREGLEKDLVDDLRKDNSPDAMAKLRHNVKRFHDEYDLYLSVKDVSAEDCTIFKGATLFRTETGFQLFLREIADRVENIVGAGRRVNVTASLGGSKLGVAFVFAGGVTVEFIRPFDWRQRFRISHEDTSHAAVLKDGMVDAGYQGLQMLEGLFGRDRIGKYGIACKGPLEVINAIKVLGPGKKLTTLPFQNYKLENLVRDDLKLRLGWQPDVELIHDGVAAILGEVAPGGTFAGKQNGMAVIIGTGVGAGILKDGDISHEYLGSIGRFLVYVAPFSNIDWEYRFVAKPTNSKEPIRDEKVLQNHVLGLVDEANKFDENDQDKFKKGIKHLSERIAGSWLAERLADKCKSNKSLMDALVALIEARGGEPKEEAERAVRDFNSHDLDKEVEKQLLVSLTEAAKAGNDKAKEFIKSVAEEIGRALGTFILEFKDEPFVNNIVLVSSIAENLGKDVKENPKGEDIFMDTIRAEAKNILEANELNEAKQIVSNIKRSEISHEREYLAFTPSGS